MTPAPRFPALAGILAGLLGAAAALRPWFASSPLSATPLIVLFTAVSACGWAASSAGWKLALRGGQWGWRLALAGLILAATSPLQLAFLHGMADPVRMRSLVPGGLVWWGALACALLVMDGMALVVLRSRLDPRSRLFNALAVAARPAIIAILLFAVPGAGLAVHRALAPQPPTPNQALLRDLALEAALRSHSNAVICVANPDSPLCRQMPSCARALGLVRAEIPPGLRAFRPAQAPPANPGSCPGQLDPVPCLLLDPASNESAAFDACLFP